ncbi:hypothetical protein ABK040_008312 [Willaertia magna]
MNHSSSNEFPIIRKECLGESKFIKMRRYTLGSECKLCGKVYTSFSWKKHPKDINYQRTMICPICAISKNLCQVTLLDLNITDEENLENNYLKNTNLDTKYKSEESDMYFIAQTERLIEEGNSNQLELLQLINKNTNLKNLDKNVEKKITKQEKKRTLQKKTLEKSNTLYIGNLNKDIIMTSTTTMIDNNVNTNKDIINNNEMDNSDYITENMLYQFFSKYGSIESIKLIPNHFCAFLTFSHQIDAENCIEKLLNNLNHNNSNNNFNHQHTFTLNGQELFIKFAKRKKQQSSSIHHNNNNEHAPLEEEHNNREEKNTINGKVVEKTMMNNESSLVGLGFIPLTNTTMKRYSAQQTIEY